MVFNDSSWEIYILNRDHSYESGVCSGCGAVLGDLDLDGVVNSDDLTKHARYVGGIITDWDQE